jgi:putative ABC transport system substrate-binding protein
MDRRRFVLTSLAGALATPLIAEAQQQVERVYRIGYLGTSSAVAQANRVEALRVGLRDLGYMEGKNIVYRIQMGRREV